MSSICMNCKVSLSNGSLTSQLVIINNNNDQTHQFQRQSAQQYYYHPHQKDVINNIDYQQQEWDQDQDVKQEVDDDDEDDENYITPTRKVITIKHALVELFNYSSSLLMSDKKLEEDGQMITDDDYNNGIAMCTDCSQLISKVYHVMLELLQISNKNQKDDKPISNATDTVYDDDDSLDLQQLEEEHYLSPLSPPPIPPERDYFHPDPDQELNSMIHSDSFCNESLPLSPSPLQATTSILPFSSPHPPCLSPDKCLTNPKLKCHLFSATDRITIHNHFWFTMKSFLQRKEYVQTLIDFVPVRIRNRNPATSFRKGCLLYHLKKVVEPSSTSTSNQVQLLLNNNDNNESKERVCLHMFLKTLGLRRGAVSKWIPKIYSSDYENIEPTSTSSTIKIKPPKKTYKKRCRHDMSPIEADDYKCVRIADRLTETSPIVLLRSTDQIPASIIDQYNSSYPKNKKKLDYRTQHLIVSNYKCSNCPPSTTSSTFNYKWALELHQLSTHEGIPPQICQYCGFASYHYLKYSSHFESHVCCSKDKSQECKFKCEYCGKRLQSLAGLQAHSWSHDNKNNDDSSSSKKKFGCPHCTSSFTLQVYLSNHIHRVHVLGKPIRSDHRVKGQCPFCGTIMRKWYLSQHIQRRHSTPMTTATVAEGTTREKVLEEKPYACPKCGNKFKLNLDMIKHLKSVHNAKPRVQCVECGLMVNKTSLRTHVGRKHNPNRGPRKRRTVKPKIQQVAAAEGDGE